MNEHIVQHINKIKNAVKLRNASHQTIDLYGKMKSELFSTIDDVVGNFCPFVPGIIYLLIVVDGANFKRIPDSELQFYTVSDVFSENSSVMFIFYEINIS